MRHSHATKQFDAAVSNVESALRDLSERLEDILPGNNRRRVTRAKRAIRRTASSITDRLPGNHGSSLVEDARRTVRDHPLQVALTAALAGYCVWSLIRLANGHSLAGEDGRSLADRFRSSQDEGVLRH